MATPAEYKRDRIVITEDASGFTGRFQSKMPFLCFFKRWDVVVTAGPTATVHQCLAEIGKIMTRLHDARTGTQVPRHVRRRAAHEMGRMLS